MREVIVVTKLSDFCVFVSVFIKTTEFLNEDMCQDRILDFLRTWLFSFSRLRQRHQELFTYPFLSVSRFLFSKTMYIVLVILSRQYKRLNSENMMKCIFSESTWYLTESLVDILTDSLFTNAESYPGFGPVRFLNWCWPSRLYTPTTTFESLFASIELIFPYVEVLRELLFFFPRTRRVFVAFSSEHEFFSCTNRYNTVSTLTPRWSL